MGSPEVIAAQVADFKQAMDRVDPSIPLVCLCGNHDVGDMPSRETIRVYSQRFGDDYFSFWVGGCRCFVVNSSLYTALDEQLWDKFPEELPNKATTLQLARTQDEWLQAELATATGKHNMVFSHIPPFICDAQGKQARRQGKRRRRRRRRLRRRR